MQAALRLSRVVNDYIQLTKPTIVVLVAITGICGMAAEGSLFIEPARMLLVLFAIIAAAGSANALNQVIDKDIDSIMDRTRSRRPIPQNQVGTVEALIFGVVVGIGSTLVIWKLSNLTAALISLGTILFYVFIYTLWLKRRYYYNIVIGGAAGATAPLIASAAYFERPTLLAWFLFAIIFFWTPPHFWALALAIKDEYAKVKIPMLPNVLGDERTKKEIFWYTVFLLPLTLAPVYLTTLGLFYGVSALLLWAWYMRETWVDLKVSTLKSYKRLFFISILYLFFLFAAAGFDGIVRLL